MIYDDLYKNYTQPLSNYLKNKYPYFSTLLIQDIIQDTFFIVYEKLPTINPNLNFFNWIVTIALNKIKDYVKKEKRYETMSVNNDYMINESDNMEQKEIEDKISYIINKLPTISKQVIILYYFNHLKIEDISLHLNKNLNTIKTILKRSKEILKKNSDIKKIFETL